MLRYITIARRASQGV